MLTLCQTDRDIYNNKTCSMLDLPTSFGKMSNSISTSTSTRRKLYLPLEVDTPSFTFTRRKLYLSEWEDVAPSLTSTRRKSYLQLEADTPSVTFTRRKLYLQ